MPGLTASHWPATDAGIAEVTLGGVLREAAAAAPERTALVDGGGAAGSRRRWTYAALLAEAERLARALLAHHAPGERIAVHAPNSAEWVLLQHAAALAGLPLVPLNPAYRRREAELMLRASRAAGLFHAEGWRDNDLSGIAAELRTALPELRSVARLEDLATYAAAGDDPKRGLPEVRPGDVSHVQFTSGTTGIPKGALIHFRGMLNSGRFVAERAEFPEGGVWVNAMPMFHSGGMATSLCGCLTRHGTFVIAPGFEAGQMLELLETERGNTTLIVPTMILALLEHPTFPDRDLTALDTVLSGATDVPEALVHRARAELGCRFSILFGQSEVCGVATATRPGDGIAEQTQTVGRPLPEIEVKIAADSDGAPVPLGEPGEICLRGYQTMHGYLDMPAATLATIDADGWLHMGDLGTMDARGFIRITGRLKDVIVRGGLNIYPREIENVLFEHPDVGQVSVVGVPDEVYGEIVAAVVIPRAGAVAPAGAALTDYCRERLARYKSPARWFFVDEFPLTASGKVQKFLLREWITQERITPSEDPR